MLAAFHGVHRDGIVVLPVGADIDQVHVLLLAEAAPGLLLAAVCACGDWLAEFRKLGLAGFHAVGKKVAESCDDRAGDIGKPLDGAAASHTEADHADADGLNRFGGKADHILLPCRTGRNSCFDDTVVG